MGKKRERQNQFLSKAAGSYTYSSDALVECALSLLRMSLEDRKGNGYRGEGNHYSANAIGSTILLVTAMDVFLNCIAEHYGSRDPETKQLAFLPLEKKYYQLPAILFQKNLSHDNDLDLVIEVRHEMVHYLPRPIPDPHNIPPWFRSLQEMGLLITTKDTTPDFAMGHKLGSYRLCYWSWQTVSRAVQNVLDTLDDYGVFLHRLAARFGEFTSVMEPVELGSFDKMYGLKLTPM